jgi:hypothetical protein
MRHWPSRGQEKREGGPIPALSVAVADWGGAVPGARCAAVSSRPGASRKPEDAAVCHGPAVGEIGDSDSSPLARNVRRTGMVVGRVVDRGGERQYGAEVHGPVGWTEISRHATQDEATAAAASWRPSR